MDIQSHETTIGNDCLIPKTASIEPGVTICDRVILDGDDIKLCRFAYIGSGAIIGCNVEVGSGAIVRPGAVVLQSIPANAIAEGNPASVVAYKEVINNYDLSSSTLVDFDALGRIEKRPFIFPLGVGLCSIHLMRQISDPRGSLIVSEIASELPFEPKRIFSIFQVPSSEIRGEHAHKKCAQFIICLTGTVRILLDNGCTRREVILDRPEMGIYMPPMIWGTQYRYSPDATLLILASLEYQSEDYIRNYDEFIACLNEDPHESL